MAAFEFISGVAVPIISTSTIDNGPNQAYRSHEHRWKTASTSTSTTQVTFDDSHAHKDQLVELSRQEFEEENARRIAKTEDRKLRGQKTLGDGAGCAQVTDKDPKAHDVKSGGQGDRLPNKKQII
ncbi:hypothetical protein MJO28_007689 [Puccinia striiformis f. sp. tritici]|uniref:Uncharacterized protein n=3 Tax=Puccinia striiformis TaxID=27350 RepID=A0A0L0VB26_9BASI|nr:hypothetical protein MJO28_007689 [Puccinia striiformis f. sp. tritici]KNE96421.1 hypothetical protein PSTG_10253 [Puccinia striiformis f. sp. tritici PST-78]POW09778.1 hypothetical protein PSTT_06558 [Puccinia striiformis]